MNDELRNIFAIVTFHAIVQKLGEQELKDPTKMMFLCESSYEIADMMLGVGNDTTRH